MTDVWKSLRAENVGGSEVAALFGESPYLTYYKLWHIKRGTLEAPNLDDNERVQAGKFMESGAIQWYNAKYKTKFFQPFQYVKHATVVGMGCTPDAFEANDPLIMAQVKIVDFIQFIQKWEAEGDTITKAPLDILLQVQHEMECCGREESHLIVVVGGNRLFRMICKRDREIGAMLMTAVQVFWGNELPPEPDFERDGEAIAEVRKKLPAKEFIDMSDDKKLYTACRKALKSTVARNKQQDMVDAFNAEVVYLVGNTGNIRCRDMIIKLPAGRKTPTYISERETL